MRINAFLYAIIVAIAYLFQILLVIFYLSSYYAKKRNKSTKVNTLSIVLYKYLKI